MVEIQCPHCEKDVELEDRDTLVKWDELYQYCLTLSGVIFLFAILRYAFQQSIRLVEFNRGKTE